jgi:micrococcal nuclease
MSTSRTLVLASAFGLSLSGCLDFGGPLLAETDDGDATGSETDTGAPQSDCGPTSAEVDRVIDGDTIVLTSGQHVRYILVNTTEITNGHDDCWGAEARDYNAQMVVGKTVTLEYDVECTDVYGRLLAYVTVDDLEINRALLELGYACLLHVPPNGNARFAEYQGYEDAARDAGLAMWGACDPVPCDW